LKSADLGAARIGYGYDIHRFVPGRKLILGGVEVPSEAGLEGHSDADVLLHAICDALLGAAALGDIGRHFPNTDPQYRGISSVTLLERVGRLLDAEGYALVNIDAMVILEHPKILPYIEAMRTRISEALGVSPALVSLKATTSERLGFAGRGEGAAAHAVAALIRV
jgi:2-C-methyl-D-erythritol 2,4-cyclodiphosphate synthase